MDVKDMKVLPSPEQLRNKIVIKAKKYTHGVPQSPPLPAVPVAPAANASPSSSPVPAQEEQPTGKSPTSNPPVVPPKNASENKVILERWLNKFQRIEIRFSLDFLVCSQFCNRLQRIC